MIENNKPTVSKRVLDFSPASFNTGMEDSQYKRDLSPFEKSQDVLASSQGFWDASGNFLANIVGSTAINTAGLGASLYGVGKAIGTGEFKNIWDNELSQSLDKVQKGLDEITPFYNSEKEDKAGLFSTDYLTSAGFWGNTVGKGVSFIAGAYLGGASLAKGGSMALKGLSRASKSFGKLVNGEEATSGLINAAKQGNIPGWIERAGKASTIRNASSYYAQKISGNMFEAGMEAKGVKEEILRGKEEEYAKLHPSAPVAPEWLKKEWDEDSSTFGNVAFGLNMLLLQIDGLGLGKTMYGYKTTKRSIEAAKDAAGKFVELSAKRKMLNKAGRIIGGGLEEAAQEGGQFIVEKTSTELGVNDKAKNFADYVNAGFKGLEQTLGTKEGQESMLAGFLLGGGGRAVGELKGATERNLQNKIGIEALNKYMLKDTIKPLVDLAGKSFDDGSGQILENATEVNDKKLFHDTKAKDFFNWASTRIEMGRYEDAVDELTQLKNTPVDVLDGIYPNHNLSEAKKHMMFDGLLNDMKDLNSMQSDVEINFGNSPYKKNILNTAYRIKNIDRRIKEMSTKDKSMLDIYHDEDLQNLLAEKEELSRDLAILMMTRPKPSSNTQEEKTAADNTDTNKALAPTNNTPTSTPDDIVSKQERKENSVGTKIPGMGVITNINNNIATIKDEKGNITHEELDNLPNVAKEEKIFVPVPEEEDDETTMVPDWKHPETNKQDVSFVDANIDTENPEYFFKGKEEFVQASDFGIQNFDKMDSGLSESDAALVSEIDDIKQNLMDRNVNMDDYTFNFTKDSSGKTSVTISKKGKDISTKVGYVPNINTQLAGNAKEGSERSILQFMRDYYSKLSGSNRLKNKNSFIPVIQGIRSLLEKSGIDITPFVRLHSKIKPGATSLTEANNIERFKVNGHLALAFFKDGVYRPDDNLPESLKNTIEEQLKLPHNRNNLGTQYVLMVQRPGTSDKFSFIGVKGRALTDSDKNAYRDLIAQEPQSLAKTLNSQLFITSEKDSVIGEDFNKYPVHYEFDRYEAIDNSGNLIKSGKLYIKRSIKGTIDNTPIKNNRRSSMSIEEALNRAYVKTAKTREDAFLPENLEKLEIQADKELFNVYFQFNAKKFEAENPFEAKQDDEISKVQQQAEDNNITNIQNVEDVVRQALSTKSLVVQGNVYVDQNNPTDNYNRVSSLKEEFIGGISDAADRGTIIDDLLRDFISGEIVTEKDLRDAYEANSRKDIVAPFTDNFIANLFTVFNKIKSNSKSIKLISNIPTLWGEINGTKIAGTIDLLGINDKGEVYIIDLKTSGVDRVLQYSIEEELQNIAGPLYEDLKRKIKANGNKINKELGNTLTDAEKKIVNQIAFNPSFSNNIINKSNPISRNEEFDYFPIYFYRESDSIQQSAYAELLRQRTGITVKNITIFPIWVTKSKQQYHRAISTVKGDNLTIKAVINRNIFPEVPKVAPQQPPVNTNKSSTEDLEILRIRNITDPEKRKVAEIAYFMNKIGESAGEAAAIKIKEYADRIIKGESRESIIQGLPKSFVEGIDQLLNTLEGGKTTKEPLSELDKLKQTPEGQKIEQERKQDLRNIENVGISDDKFVVKGKESLFHNHWDSQSAAKAVNDYYDNKLNDLKNKPVTEQDVIIGEYTVKKVGDKYVIFIDEDEIESYASLEEAINAIKEIDDTASDAIKKGQENKDTSYKLEKSLEEVSEEDRSKIEREVAQFQKDLDRILPGIKVNLDFNQGFSYYRNAVITLTSGQVSKAKWHEAFHAIFDCFSPEEKNRAIKIAMNNFSIDRETYDMYREFYDKNYEREIALYNAGKLPNKPSPMSEEKLISILYEEKIADLFQDYMQNIPVEKGLFQRFFDAIAKFIMYLGGRTDETPFAALFDSINRGDFANRSPIQGEELVRMKLPNATSKQSTDLINNLGVQTLDALAKNPKLEVDVFIKGQTEKYRTLYSESSKSYIKDLKVAALRKQITKEVFADKMEALVKGNKIISEDKLYPPMLEEANDDSIIDAVKKFTKLVSKYEMEEDEDSEDNGEKIRNTSLVESDIDELIEAQAVQARISYLNYIGEDGMLTAVDGKALYDNLKMNLEGVPQEKFNEVISKLASGKRQTQYTKSMQEFLKLFNIDETFRTQCFNAFSNYFVPSYSAKIDVNGKIVKDGKESKGFVNEVYSNNSENYTDTQVDAWRSEMFGKEFSPIKSNEELLKYITIQDEVFDSLEGQKTLTKLINSINDKLSAGRDSSAIINMITTGTDNKALRDLADENIKYRLDLGDLTYKFANKNFYSMLKQNYVFTNLKNSKYKWGVFTGVNYKFDPNKPSSQQLYREVDPATYLTANLQLYSKDWYIPQQMENKSTVVTLKGNSYTKLNLESVLSNEINRQTALIEKYKNELKAGKSLVKGFHIYKNVPDEIKLIEGFEKFNNSPKEILSLIEKGVDRNLLPRAYQYINIPGANQFPSNQNVRYSAEATAEFIANELADMKEIMEKLGIPDNYVSQFLEIGKGGIDGAIENFVTSQYLNRVEMLAVINPELTKYKDFTDITKRGAGLLLAGPSHYNANKPATFGRVVLKDVSYTINSKTMTRDDGASLDEENKKALIKEINATDAQGIETIGRRLDRHLRLGRASNDVNNEFYKKTKLLLAYKNDDRAMIKELESSDMVLMVDKTGGFDGDTYIKTSIFPLTRAFTSYQVPANTKGAVKDTYNGKYYLPYPHRTQSFSQLNKLQALEEKVTNEKRKNKQIGVNDEIFFEAHFESAVKLGLSDINNINSEEYSYSEFGNINYRLQQENPSGKDQIKDGTQLIQLIGAFLPDNISFAGYDSKEKILASMSKLLANLREFDRKMIPNAFKKLELLAENEGGVYVPFIKYLQDSAESSAGSDNDREFLASKDGEFIYSQNMPHLINGFEQSFISYFNKNLFSQKTPGGKATLVSSVYSEVMEFEGKVISTWEFENKLTPKQRAKVTSRPLKCHKPGGTVEDAYAEVILSEEYLEDIVGITLEDYHNLSDFMKEKVKTILGFRIPTQSHHSMMPCKVVDFAPRHYGSMVIAPSEITYLSGADYDVDSLFYQRYSFYTNKDGELGLVQLDSNSYFDTIMENKLVKEYMQMNEPQIDKIKIDMAKKKASISFYKSKINQYTEDPSLAKNPNEVEELNKKLNKTYEELNSLKKSLYSTKRAALKTVLEVLGFPKNEKEFEKARKDGKAGEFIKNYNNNSLLSNRLKILTANFDGKFSPAVDKFQNLFKDEDIGPLLPKSEKKREVYASIVTFFQHYINNYAGGRAIGASANGNKVFAHLHLTNSSLSSSAKQYLSDVNFGGPISAGLYTDTNDTSAIDYKIMVVDGKLVFGEKYDDSKPDNLSSAVSMTVDNVKDQTLVKFNLNDKLMPLLTNAFGIGIGNNVMATFLLNPITKIFSEKYMKTMSPFASGDKSIKSVIAEMSTNVERNLEFQINESNLNKYLEDATTSLKDKEQLLRDVIDGKINKNELPLRARNFIERQFALLDLYGFLSVIAEDHFVVNTLLNLNKELGEQSSDVDYVLARYKKAIDGDDPEKGKYFSFDYNIPSSVNANINSVIQSRRILSDNLLFYNSFEKVFEHVDKHCTKYPSSKADFESKVGIRKEFLNYLIIKSYAKYSSSDISTDRLDLVKGGMIELYEKNKSSILKYPFGKMLTRVSATSQYPFERLGMDSFKKLDPRKKDDVMDSFASMLIDPDTKEFATNFLSYLATHDNFRFIGQSAVSFMRPSIFKALNEVIKGYGKYDGVEGLFSGNELDIEKVASQLQEDGSFRLLFRDFLKFWFSDNRNKRTLVTEVKKVKNGLYSLAVDPQQTIPVVAFARVDNGYGGTDKILLMNVGSTLENNEKYANYEVVKSSSSSWKMYQYSQPENYEIYKGTQNKGTQVSAKAIDIINSKKTLAALQEYGKLLQSSNITLTPEQQEAFDKRLNELKGGVVTTQTSGVRDTKPSTKVVIPTISKRLNDMSVAVQDFAKEFFGKTDKAEGLFNALSPQDKLEFFNLGTVNYSIKDVKNLSFDLLNDERKHIYYKLMTGESLMQAVELSKENLDERDRLKKMQKETPQEWEKNLPLIKENYVKFLEEVSQNLLTPLGYSEGAVNLDTQIRKDDNDESNTTSFPNFVSTGKASVFSYKGREITTQFNLSPDQNEALEKLIDFSMSNKKVITLEGAAGTGKTTIIGYLQKYLGNVGSFAFMAPTHSATAELAFATVKTGNTDFPSTVASSVTTDKLTGKYVFSKKVRRKFATNPIIVIDESSMLGLKEIEKLLAAAEEEKVKVIFMGDIKQIPEVNTKAVNNKPVSVAFTKFDKVKLSYIHRTSNPEILDLLSAVRASSTFNVPTPSENTENLQFLSANSEFDSKYFEDLKKDSENTILITYRNKDVSLYNNKARKVLGREGNPVVGDVITGYIGYASKQIEKGDIANSIRYTIASIQNNGSSKIIQAFSEKLNELTNKGVNVSPEAGTIYYQLSNTDSFTFDDLTVQDFANNNRYVSDLFKTHHLILQEAKKTKRWGAAEKSKADLEATMRKVSLGGDYVYNPATDRMEKYDKIYHSEIDSSLRTEKDIDYGHAITIHKSQGTTIKNVYFDLFSVQMATDLSIVDGNGVQITSERQALAYVGLSRSQSKLVALAGRSGENNFFGESQEEDDSHIPPRERKILSPEENNVTGFSINDLFKGVPPTGGLPLAKLHKSLFKPAELQDAPKVTNTDALNIVINKIKSNFAVYKDVLGVENVEQLDNLNSSQVAALINKICKS
jgi:exodeoxyribonuclease-5